MGAIPDGRRRYRRLRPRRSAAVAPGRRARPRFRRHARDRLRLLPGRRPTARPIRTPSATRPTRWWAPRPADDTVSRAKRPGRRCRRHGRSRPSRRAGQAGADTLHQGRQAEHAAPSCSSSATVGLNTLAGRIVGSVPLDIIAAHPDCDVLDRAHHLTSWHEKAPHPTIVAIRSRLRRGRGRGRRSSTSRRCWSRVETSLIVGPRTATTGPRSARAGRDVRW